MYSPVLIAHPHKHHALHMVAGCIGAGMVVKYATPFYVKGPALVFTYFPGILGKKARGYRDDSIDSDFVLAKPNLAIAADIAFRRTPQLAGHFDQLVSSRLASGSWKCDLLVTLQDYMPRTVTVARQQGIRIFSDQILNQSDSVQSRIRSHYQKFSLPYPTHDETINTDILKNAHAVSYPNSYCRDGIQSRLSSSVLEAKIPYGVDGKKFSNQFRAGSNRRDIKIIARANSVRKGGHLILQAVAESGDRMVKAAGGRSISLIILGKLEPVLQQFLSELKTPIKLEAKDFAASEVPLLMASADLFLMPSLTEGMSLACLEAMQCGLPVVITRFCGIDAAVHGTTGLLIEDTVHSVAEGLSEAIKRRDEWGGWGTEGRLRTEDLTWGRYESDIGAFIAKAAT